MDVSQTTSEFIRQSNLHISSARQSARHLGREWFKHLPHHLRSRTGLNLQTFIHRDFPVMCFDDLHDDGQANARPLGPKRKVASTPMSTEDGC